VGDAGRLVTTAAAAANGSHAEVTSGETVISTSGVALPGSPASDRVLLTVVKAMLAARCL
jgi:hypothetical protein